jgi:hypothetical protein
MAKPTPFDGSSSPFTIGLKPLDLADWIDIDDTFDMQLAEKRRLYAERKPDVLVAEDGTERAQQEVLDLLSTHLLEQFPGRYVEGLDRFAQHRTAKSPADTKLTPLHRASLLVQEDLILMREGKTGWRLTAGSLCFPSSWTLTEKFGLPIHQIHQPVPDFGEGSRNNELITRMFDRLHQPVLRFNWSIQANPDLYHPMSNASRDERAGTRPSRFGGADVRDAAFIRVERQTLRKLPVSGDILFTIRIYLDPLGAIARHADRVQIARSMAAQLLAMNSDQLDYKGLTADRDRLVGALEEIADRRQV